MVVGVSLSKKSDIAGYQKVSKSIVSSTEPCGCGILSCKKCPIFGTMDTRLPILNQQKLPPAAQQGLNELMVREALRSALEVLEAHPSFVSENWMKQQMTELDAQCFQWQTSSQSKSSGGEVVSDATEDSPKDEL